jgi:hypothetical protein
LQSAFAANVHRRHRGEEDTQTAISGLSDALGTTPHEADLSVRKLAGARLGPQ